MIDVLIERDLQKEFKFFENSKISVLFHINSGSFYRVYDLNIVKKLSIFFDEKMKKNDEFLIDVKSLLENVNVSENLIPEPRECYINTPNSKNFTINKLALVLTSECNLRCKYCYANFGMYGYKEKNFLDIKALDEIIDYFSENFAGIANIQFFGGEPSLCEEEIIYTVNKFNLLYKAGKIANLPRYGIVTNGISISDKLINVFFENDFIITVSVDGSQDINDILRKDLSNNGSFKRLEKSIMSMMNKGIKNISIESTYTNKHIEKNISLVDIVKFMNEKFSVLVTHIVPVQIDKNSDLFLGKNKEKFEENLIELVNYTFSNFMETGELNTSSIVQGIIANIITKHSATSICPAGVNTFSIAADMKIQPCFMYTSNKDSIFGNINDDSNIVLRNAYEYDKNINNKEKFKECFNCFLRNICSSCMGNFIQEEHMLKSKDDIICFSMRIVGREVLYNLSKIQSNRNMWESFHKLILNKEIKYEDYN